MPDKAPLAVSFGEPAGIGPDIILSAFQKREALSLPPFAVYGPRSFFEQRIIRLGLDIKVEPTTLKKAASVFETALPLIELENGAADEPGRPNAANAPAVIEAIDRAVADCQSGAARALVTAPIQKSALYEAGFKHPGHTEYIAARCQGDDGERLMPVMMIAAGDFRSVPVTIHIPLMEVPWRLTTALIASTGRIVAQDLRSRFGIENPRLAITGLNPHAGEGGALGAQDDDIVRPAIEQLRDEEIDVTGPMPADTAYAPAIRANFDAIIAMYHDQALAPIKAVAFDEAVNVTLGLPIIRTSPDHGTAIDLAGSGKARDDSFIAAIRLADTLSDG
ncbi:4-hydroxythreonine-4-phosphate dehydrogenase PdxA [Cucumibacter marinus]|uniref:4-hydroxythreonine-4-phosphate dehydrogenase PdxA n=1 Tax=Cucumibacter marinus TaxID=1121252 RepID=UPI0003F7A1F2|nr:4-hydroxythreonine-4-phosphate dehydrogenase PdxA [Cucumibacter marinus]